jgi:hypothetical protein
LETDLSNLIVNAIFIIIIFSLITLAISEVIKKKVHFIIKFIVGIFTILFGILISYLLLTLGETEYYIYIKIGFQLLPLWIILYGVYEIKNGINSLKKTN